MDKAKGFVFSRSGSLGFSVAAVCTAALLCASARADDYILAAGESDTISTNVTYETITVDGGNLTVDSNAKVYGDKAKSVVITLNGGTLTIDGQNTAFGHRANGGDSRLAVMNPGADGKYTKVTVRNGKGTDAVNSDYFNFSAKTLTISAATEAALEQYPNGMFDLFDISGSSVNFFRLINDSSLTGRITVAGNCLLGKGNGYDYGGGFFSNGNFRVELADGSKLRFNASNQMGAYNAPETGVYVTGGGNLELMALYNTNYTTRTMINKGAVFDTTGTITFESSWYNANFNAWFQLLDDDIFGPSVSKVQSGSDGNYGATFEVAKGVAVRVPDFEMARRRDGLIGDGTVRIDARAKARTFKANIPATYVVNQKTWTPALANNITVSKFGSYEAEIVATNLPTLKVEEGVVRLTTDCVVGCLRGASGTKVVADGCTVTILSGWHVPNGLELDTANGGKFVKAGSGTAYLYGPSVLGTDLHVAEGGVVFSEYGLTQKYWRWTFTKTGKSPNPVWPGRVWMFDVDGGHATTGMRYSSTANTTASLAANYACWEYSSATNIARENQNSWQWEDRLQYVLGIDDLWKNMNNFFRCSSPVVDPENTDSWLGFGMRLADDAKPVSGYNIMAGDDKHYPVSWTVEVSDNGTEWTEVEAQSDFAPVTPAYPFFYDGEKVSIENAPAVVRGKPIEYFKFSGYKRNGLEADAAKAVSLQVDNGASVDFTAFTVAPQKIGSITVDMAAGGGTILGGAAAEDGTLYIKNADQGFSLGSALPLVLDGLADRSNLETWSVVVDGVEKGFRVTVASDGHLLVVNPGLTVIVR